MEKFKGSLYLSFILFVASLKPAYAATITVAVASNFSAIFEDLQADFESLNPGNKIVLVSGSSGKIYAQIKHGAPFDVFLSADQEKPLRLVEEGLALANTRFTYAIGSLILWSADSGMINNSSQVLVSSSYSKIALANSKLAPYGLAAEQVLSHLGLLSASRVKWVQGENIAQTYQFVETGNADLGFVAKSQVWKNDRLAFGSAWLIPPELYSSIKQDAVILKATKNIHLANRLMNFLQATTVRNKIKAYGYQPMSLKSTLQRGVSR